MKTPSTRKTALDAVRAELISMIPWAYRSMAKPYITHEVVERILDAALDATQAATRECVMRREGWLVDPRSLVGDRV
jgi:hypothetical protein